MDAVLKWMSVNQLKVAAEKCSVLHIGNQSMNLNRSYTFDTNAIPSVAEMKDLGVTIDSELNFSSHIAKITTKAFQRSNLFFRVFECRDRDFLVAIFKVYIRPLLEYCSSIWSPIFKKDMIAIERVQRQFTKRVPGLAEHSYMERLQILGLETLELRRLQSDLCMCYKIVNGKIDVPFHEFFVLPPQSQENTRAKNSRKLFCQYSRSNCRKNFFSNSVVPVWNDLPEYLISAPSIDSFKVRLRKYDLQRYLSLGP